MNKKIIVPTDFTKVAGQALRQAVAIASHAGWGVTLLHVTEEPKEKAEAVREKLRQEAEAATQRTGVQVGWMLGEGGILDAIPDAVSEKEFDLMVIGTPGPHGIRQMIFGADIVKLIARIPIPVLVVQEDSPLVERFSRIVLPVGSHATFGKAVEAVLLLAGIYDSEVHLYSIHKPGFEWPMQMLTNIDETKELLERHNIRMVRVKEEQDVFSQGFAKQTLKYARSIGAETIWMMAIPSDDYYYLAQAYKEAMLLNEHRLPILCAGGGR